MHRHEVETLAKGVLPDPAALVKRQLARDKAHTAWKPALLDRKNARMRVSPFAFLRGTAPLYYELLATCPWLAEGPPGEGWIDGDLHIENFGASRRASETTDSPEVVFDLNDFDDAAIGPWYLDVLRLTTSVLLAARATGAEGPDAIALGRGLLDSYRETMASGHIPKPPKLVTTLVEKVKNRTKAEWLDQRTKVTGKHRRFIRSSDRYDDVPAELSGVQGALHSFTPADGSPRPPDDHLELIDAAFRIAGTGSLGSRRIAALVSGKGGVDGCWVFDLKEEGDPSAGVLLGPSPLEPNIRVVTAARAGLARPPLMMGTTKLGGRPMIIRRLMPQEDKVDSGALKPAEFADLVHYFGALASLAHTRGVTKAPKHPWTLDECGGILANAVTLAGWHEGAYLAYGLALAGESSR